MKRLAILSLLANLILGVLLVMPRARPDAASSSGSASTGPQERRTPTTTNLVEITRVITNASPGFSWAMVESEDYPTYMENLRRLEVPEWLVRELILLELGRHYELRELAELGDATEHWATYSERLRLRRERANARVALALEERDVMRRLTGTYRHGEGKDFADNDGFHWVLGVLPLDTAREAMSELVLQYEINQLLEDQVGLVTPSDRQQMLAGFNLARNRALSLAAPALTEEFWLRLQVLLGIMMDDFDFPGLQLTGPQFRELIRIRFQFIDPIADEFSNQPEPTGAELAQRERNVRDALAAVLGEKLADDYARSRNPAFRTIHEFTEKQQLPIESAIFIHDVRQAAINEVRNVMTNPQVQPEQRLEHRQMVQRETEALLFDALGPETFQSYKENEGAWLNRVGGSVPSDDAGGAR